MPSLLMRYRIAHSIAQSIMTSVALVVVAGSRCGVAKLRCCGVAEFRDLPSFLLWKADFGDSDVSSSNHMGTCV